MQRPRPTVISTRLDATSFKPVEALVESSLVRSRSAAVAMLVARGVARSPELIAHAQQLA